MNYKKIIETAFRWFFLLVGLAAWAAAIAISVIEYMK